MTKKLKALRKASGDGMYSTYLERKFYACIYIFENNVCILYIKPNVIYMVITGLADGIFRIRKFVHGIQVQTRLLVSFFRVSS